LRPKQIEYLSGFERNLNDWLWATAILAGIYAFVQHVMLSDSPEVFSHGAELGDLLYDLAIAYIAAFVFYVLVVQRPLQRDRTNMYQYLAPIFRRVAGEAVGLMTGLNQAADVEPGCLNTWSNVEATCKILTPTTEAKMLWRQPDGSTRPATVMEMIGYHIGRAREVNSEIMKFATYLDSDAVKNIAEIDACGFFRFHEFTGGQMGNNDLSAFSRTIFEYLRLVDRHSEYCREIGLDGPSPAALPWDGEAVPLSREMHA
jgi:hypothetical protein